MKDIILAHTDNIFLALFNDEKKQFNTNPNLPEDLCFFKNNKILLGTVSHAQLCRIYPTCSKILKSFQEIAVWNQIGDDCDIERDYICLKSYNF